MNNSFNKENIYILFDKGYLDACNGIEFKAEEWHDINYIKNNKKITFNHGFGIGFSDAEQFKPMLKIFNIKKTNSYVQGWCFGNYVTGYTNGYFNYTHK